MRPAQGVRGAAGAAYGADGRLTPRAGGSAPGNRGSGPLAPLIGRIGPIGSSPAQLALSSPEGRKKTRTAVAPATAHSYPRRAPAGRDYPPARARTRPPARKRIPRQPWLLPAASRRLAAGVS